MNLKNGDRVKLAGKESTIETSWGAGAHKVFKLTDGREILDLDKLVVNNKATLMSKLQPSIAPVLNRPSGIKE